jgi:hypothetical protein
MYFYVRKIRFLKISDAATVYQTGGATESQVTFRSVLDNNCD